MNSYQLITRNLQEVINPESLINVLSTRPARGYWRIIPTSSIHLGYFGPLLKLRDFVQAGCEITILIDDVHVMLNYQTTSDNWTKYTIRLIKSMLKLLKVDVSQIKFVVGSSYQLTPDVTFNLYKLINQIPIQYSMTVGAEVVKHEKNPKLINLLYPLLNLLDEKYLQADFALGEANQRKNLIYNINNNLRTDNNQTQCTYLLIQGLDLTANPPAVVLNGVEKRSTSSSDKIDILERPKSIETKIRKSCCLDRQNAILALYHQLIFRLDDEFRFEKNGEHLIFTSYEQLENSFIEGNISSIDLKTNLSSFLIEFLKPIRKEFSRPFIIK